ncbi:hypothetical protein [Catalinimonas niigatensis]|uniref:hypothetical protein n=1 Tax=Catalinimonas niigatensis TaxID=1397264 RepID=UPI0026667F35|nr:hypothetical protein [Catalinimonas niigatensis]WPP53258.1 hypothetical protein PZB72_12835 [Catalinimonas niigatensis]
MKSLLKILSLVGLLLTLIPSILYFSGYISAEQHKLLMLIGTALWFLTAPFWMNKSEEAV